MSENFIQKSSKRFTILRVAGLLDKSSRINSIQKIIANNNQRISLSSSSTLNYILYEDLLNFIEIIIKKKKFGIFNVSANKNIKLNDLKKSLNLSNVKFGSYDYITPKVDNTKAKKVYANLKLTTYQNIKKYLKKNKEN
jgi:dTDP-4-dehydrorhamnose reductase